MKTSRLSPFAFAGLIWLVLVSPANATAQSLEETYDATFAAYNSTLNQLEDCDQRFAAFQQFFKDQRPPAGASKEEWDTWAKAYRTWVEIFTACMRKLRSEADVLKKKLDELEVALGSVSDSAQPRKEDDDKKKKARDLLRKGTNDLGQWTVGAQYKIQRVNDWSKEASDQVKEHGSGAVRIEPRLELKF